MRPARLGALARGLSAWGLRARGLLACGLLGICGAGDARADGHDGRAQLAGDLARCAAYYFNATKAKPIGEYEAFYSAGERAFNRAARLIDRETLDGLVADAAIEMTATIGGDWRNFGRVEARYAGPCDDLERLEER